MGGHSHPRGVVVDIQFARGLVQSPPVRAVTERLVPREPAGADIEGLTIRRLYLIRPVPVVSHEPGHYVIRHLTRLKIFFRNFSILFNSLNTLLLNALRPLERSLRREVADA